MSEKSSSRQGFVSHQLVSHQLVSAGDEFCRVGPCGNACVCVLCASPRTCSVERARGWRGDELTVENLESSDWEGVRRESD